MAENKRSMSSTRSVYSAVAKENPQMAEIALLEENHCDRLSDVVENTIDKEVLKYLPQVKEMIDNLEKYGDSGVYKVLPKELDKKMRVYGLNIVESYLNKNIRGNNEYTLIPHNYRQCSYCGRYLNAELNFYGIYKKDESDIRRVNMCCKNCADTIFKNAYRETDDLKESLVLCSQKLDIITFDNIIQKYLHIIDTEDGKIAFRNGSYLGLYVADCQIEADRHNIPENERDFQHSEIGGPLFKDFTFEIPFKPIYPVNEVTDQEESEDNTTIKDVQRLKAQWGPSFSKKDLEWLDNKENEWYDNYEIYGKQRELLVQQLCLEELQLFKARNKGEDCTKKLKNIQDLLKSSDLTPKSTEVDNPSQKFKQFGEFIKEVETTEPIINEDPEFEDVDNIRKMWKQIAGAIIRTAGKQDKLVEEFEENMKDYTVDFIKDAEEDNADEP